MPSHGFNRVHRFFIELERVFKGQEQISVYGRRLHGEYTSMHRQVKQAAFIAHLVQLSK